MSTPAFQPDPCTNCGSSDGTGTPDAPLLTGVRRFIGLMNAFDLAALHPGLQSVTLVVLTGNPVEVTTSDGAGQPVPAGVSLTWSVADTDDSSLAAMSFNGAGGGGDFLLAFTYKPTVQG
ncbi:MAG: hypothetical protein LC792_15460 [Actinobacteria bacterium]|nr:hypothetical protein [Actinomycetota bacterium]